MDEKLTSARLKIQPSLSLKQVSYKVIELIENDSNNCEESSSVVINMEEKEKIDVEVKIEMKEETEFIENIEVEFVSNNEGEF